MTLGEQIIKQDQQLYFVKGFYEDYYLVQISHRVREVKLNEQLLEVLRISHDEARPIEEAIKIVLGTSRTEDKENLLQEQIDWLHKKGMVQFI